MKKIILIIMMLMCTSAHALKIDGVDFPEDVRYNVYFNHNSSGELTKLTNIKFEETVSIRGKEFLSFSKKSGEFSNNDKGYLLMDHIIVIIPSKIDSVEPNYTYKEVKEVYK